MAAKKAFISFCLLLVAQLLLAPTETTAITIPAATAPPAGVGGIDPVLPFPIGGAEAAVADCWKAVLQAESCARDILRSLVSQDAVVHVGAACCGVLQAVGSRCLHDLFPKSPFSPIYAPLVNHACGFPATSLVPGRRD